MADNFYKKSTSSVSFYDSTTSGTEPNMRQELINTFDGSFPEVAKAQIGLIRKMDRENGELIPCSCVDLVTKEPDKDRFCPICYGEGFLWTESEMQIYRVLEDSDVDNALMDTHETPGLINVPLVVFYIRYDSDITKDDKVVRLELELDGTPVSPSRRKALYRVNLPWDFRSDNGKLEYWKVYTHFEDVKFLNAPEYRDV